MTSRFNGKGIVNEICSYGHCLLLQYNFIKPKLNCLTLNYFFPLSVIHDYISAAIHYTPFIHAATNKLQGWPCKRHLIYFKFASSWSWYWVMLLLLSWIPSWSAELIKLIVMSMLWARLNERLLLIKDLAYYW